MSLEVEVTKSNGSIEPYQRIKLEQFLHTIGVDKNNIEPVIREVEKELYHGISTSEIYERAHHVLRDKGAFHPPRFSLKHAIALLGPTGFPFERFVARLFRQQGYDVLLDVQIRGACAMHEVDVLAYNENEIIVCEIKFHNEVGIKSDLKVALYVHARFEDLVGRSLEIIGDHAFATGTPDRLGAERRDQKFIDSKLIARKITKGMLITNTKFSTSALEYAMCKGLNVVGWSTPPGMGLEALIIKHKMYPVTCLSTLSTVQKQTLMGLGIMVVQDVIDKKQEIARVLALTPEDIDDVLKEASRYIM